MQFYIYTMFVILWFCSVGVQATFGQSAARAHNDVNSRLVEEREINYVTLLPPVPKLAASPIYGGAGVQAEHASHSLANSLQGGASGQVDCEVAGLSEATLPKCATCIHPKPILPRRLLDRFASGFDYLVFGVTSPTQAGSDFGFKGEGDGCPHEDSSKPPASSTQGYSRWGQATQGRGRSVGETRELFGNTERELVGGDGVAPAVTGPPPFSVIPQGETFDFGERFSRGSEVEGKGGWKPATNPFEDDPLQTGNDGSAGRGNDFGAGSGSNRFDVNQLEDNKFWSVGERRAEVMGGEQDEGGYRIAGLSFAGSPMLDGYCAVSMSEQREWVIGKQQFGVIHLGKVYHFSSSVAQEKFLQSPQRYSPVLNGIDVVRLIDERKIVTGSSAFGWFDRECGHVFLFSSEETANRFNQYPEYYSMHAMAIMNRAMADYRR